MNIFDLEQKIMNAWNVVDDVDDVYKYVGDDPFFKGMDPKHADKIMNLLLGIKEMYNLRFESLWRDFEDVCRDFHKYRKFYEGTERESFDDVGTVSIDIPTVDVSLTDYTLNPTTIPEGTVTVNLKDTVNFDTWSAWSGYQGNDVDTQISFEFGEVASK